MSTNMTRKGLALGAGIALVGAGLVATTPAYAASELILEPNAGTEYAMIEGETFTLKVYGNAEFLASNGSQIRFHVENDGAASFDTFKINSTQMDDNYGDGSTEYVSDGGHTTNGNSIKFTGVSGGTAAKIGTADGDEAVLGLGASRDALDASSTSLMTAPATLSFTNSTVVADTTEKLKVTAWADADNDGVMDAGEVTSATRTISFYDAADTDIAPSISAQAWSGDHTFKATFNYGIINEAQMSLSKVGLKALNNASAIPDKGVSAGSYEDGTTPAVALNTAKTAFEVTISNEPTTDGSTVAFATTGNSSSFTLEAQYDVAGTDPDGTDDIFAAVTNKTVTVLSRTLNTSNSAANIVTSSDAVVTTSGSAADARLNTAFDVAVSVKDGSTPAVALPALAATATVASSETLSASKYLTIDGVAYTSSSALAAAEFATSTNVLGVADVTIVPTGFADGNTITVTWSIQGYDFTGVVVTQQKADYSMNFVQGNETGNDGYEASIAVGGSHTFSIAVADQFGVAPANGTYNVSVSRAATTGVAARTTAAVFAAVEEVVDGVATVTVTDNGAGVGSDTITTTLVGGSVTGGTSVFDLSYTTAAAVTPTTLTITDDWDGTADSDVRLNAKAVPSWHPYLTGGLSAPSVTNNFKDGATTGASDATLTVSGTLVNAGSAGIEGSPVTISGTGLTFAFADGAGNTIYSRDSITVPTSAAGAYSVDVYSDATGGDVVITATSAGMSKTTTVSFAAGAADTFTVSTPAQSAPGKTVDVIVDVTDANGNPVQGASLTLSSTGPGYLINTSGTTLSNGRYTTKLLLGANDTGTAVVSVTMTVDGTETTKTSSVVVSNNPTSSADQKVNAGSFKGFVAVYAKGYEGSRLSAKIGNDWVIVPALASDFERVTDLTGAGVDIAVRIYIDRVLLDTINLTTK